jgi:MoaA/NifB/PqqE/SkfB family radical SAM enzyme
MNKNDFKKLIEKYPYIEIFNLSGGEPTLNPNLMSIISFLKKRGKKILIGTNGLKTSDKAFLKNLENAGLDGLMLAFNSYSKKIEKKLRGINLIPSTINTIQNLKKTN